MTGFASFGPFGWLGGLVHSIDTVLYLLLALEQTAASLTLQLEHLLSGFMLLLG